MRTGPFLIPVTVYIGTGDSAEELAEALLRWLCERARRGVRDFTVNDARAGLALAGVELSSESLRRALVRRMMNHIDPRAKGPSWTAAPEPVVARTARGRYRFVGKIDDGTADPLPRLGASPSSLGAAVLIELAPFQTPSNRIFTIDQLRALLAQRGIVVTEEAVSEELEDLHVIGAAHLRILRDGRYRLIPHTASKHKPKRTL